MKHEIRMIPIYNLEHHPENPRKDLGDLTELADSLRKNGILQNLTVVPIVRDMTEAEWKKAAKLYQDHPTEELRTRMNKRIYVDPDNYWVVIGNRRLEAARIAGMPELPCVISDMDHRTQVATMLEENMQRADLTLYEQAQGFQMMMDLGFTPKEISEKTGFSETTVNRRLKMAELDGKAFGAAVGKQITIDDLDRLGKIKSVKERNMLLKKFGDNNFDWELTNALRVQKANEMRTEANRQLQAAKVKKLPDGERYSSKYDRLWDKTCKLYDWDWKKNIIPDVDGELYYVMNTLDVEFYVKSKKKQSERVEKTEEEKAEEKAIALAWKTAERVTDAAFELRKEYVESMKVTPKNAMEMLQWALIAAIAMIFDYDTPTNALRQDSECPIEGYNTPENIAAARKWIMEMNQSRWPRIIWLLFEGDTAIKESKNGYADGSKRERPKWKANKRLDLEYEWLQQFGYQMSDEEEQMQSGTHEMFQVKV